MRRWYRAPELLFGAHHYDLGVDLWAAGAIIGELYNLNPLFAGSTDINQIYRILQVMHSRIPPMHSGIP